MGPDSAATTTAASKRRGRPLSKPSEETAAVQARRERNREAQNVFRKRRQAAEAAQVQRLQRLEEVVEEMSSVFMSFVDEMLQTETVRSDSRLVDSLRRSTTKMLALANEVVGPEDGDVGAEAKTAESKTPDSSSSSSSPSSSSSLSPQHQTSLERDTYPSPTASSSELQPHPQPHPELPLQIYGNGWQDFPLSPKPPPSLNINPKDLGPLPPLDVDSFAYRLVKATMTTGYLVLSRAPNPPVPHSEEQRMFGSTLRFRSREELLSRMRYLLGPGTKDLSYAAQLPYGLWGDFIFSRSDLTSSAAPEDPCATPIAGIDRFLSVAGVEKQLISLGARIVDSETLELNISSPPHLSPISSISSPEPSSTQLDTWSFIDFFSSGQPQPKPTVLRMTLSISLLVADLSRRAVCLLRGPGFPRSELGKAIEASIITAAGGDVA